MIALVVGQESGVILGGDSWLGARVGVGGGGSGGVACARWGGLCVGMLSETARVLTASAPVATPGRKLESDLVHPHFPWDLTRKVAHKNRPHWGGGRTVRW